MTNKSINANEVSKNAISKWFDTVFTPIMEGMNYLNSLYPDYQPNNAPASGINPQEYVETQI
jgi:hypothetical protein